MIKYSKLITVVFITTFLGCKSNNQVESNNKQNEKPNVILVITDDQGYGDIAAHGNSLIQTPNIDAFYNESYHLTDFHVGPTCAPTRSGLMTGRVANSVGVWHTVGGWSLLREREKTLADMFTEAGYKTGAFGKWHLGDNYPFRAHDRGFQHTVMHYGGGVQQTPDYWGNDYFDDTYFKNGEPTPYKGYCTDIFFDEAINFIKNSKEAPFFCYISTNAPHGPYNVPMEYYNLYKDISDDLLTDIQKRFYGMITNVDDNFGKLRKALKEWNIADNTILIFMTDNGTSAGFYNKKGITKGFNAGMRGNKGSEYEGGHRVPFFIYWKDGNISTSKDIDILTANLDIMPTLAELCNIPLPKDHMPLHGESLVSILNGSQTTNDRMLITDSQRLQQPEKWRHSAVMQNKWRLINGTELYNIENDQGQDHDLANEYPNKVEEMRAFYEQWWNKISVDFDEEIYFKVGSPYENPLTLTAHDIHSPENQYPWNQIAIREGFKSEGYWSIDVLESGSYKVSLRRYPIESNLMVNDTVAGVSTEELPGLEFDIPSGKDLNYTQGYIKIGERIERSKPINPTDKSVDFIIDLEKGKTKLWSEFTNGNNERNVAYYVYIEKIS